MVSPSVVLTPTSLDSMPVLRRLFGDPSFRGWGGTTPLSDDEIAAKYAGARLPDVECFIVEADRSAVGLALLHSEGDAAGGMDLILLPGSRGRGVGRSVVAILVERAKDQHGWCRLTVDPDVSNEAGIRFWADVGFREVGGESATGDRRPFILMEMLLTSQGDD
jgi:GNAT superfamily N-acetyltransferase